MIVISANYMNFFKKKFKEVLIKLKIIVQFSLILAKSVEIAIIFGEYLYWRTMLLKHCGHQKQNSEDIKLWLICL